MKRAVLALCGGLSACAVLNPIALADWSTFQGNASHTGYVPGILPAGMFSLKWAARPGDLPGRTGPALGSVAVGGGKVYVSEFAYFGTQYFFALDAQTGQTSWNKEFIETFSVNAPAYSGGRVYFQTCNHTPGSFLRSYDAATGADGFASPISAQWERYYSPTIFGGQAYINAGYYGGMYSFNATSGGQNWFASMRQYDMWTPAVTATKVVAYHGSSFATDPGVLTVADRLTGNVQYTISDPNFTWAGWSIYGAPVLNAAETRAYMVTNGRTVAFNLANQSIAWQVSGNYNGQAALAGGVLFAPSSTGLAALSESTGATLWSWPSGGESLIGNVLATDNLVFVSTATTTYAISIATHAQVWSYPLGGGQLAIDGNTLYISSNTGMLAAIALPAPTTGSLALTAAVFGLRRKRRS